MCADERDDLPMQRRHQFRQHERACRDVQPFALAVPAPNRIVRYMQPKASSMPTIQNQIGILPSKYCTATIAGRPTALTMMERRNGTRRYSTAMYTMHAAHSQMAVYERGMSGKVWVTGTVDGTDAANTCTMCAAFVASAIFTIFAICAMPAIAPIICRRPCNRSALSETLSCAAGSRAAARRST